MNIKLPIPPSIKTNWLEKRCFDKKGVYCFYDDKKLLYVGKTISSFGERIGQHYSRKKQLTDYVDSITLYPLTCNADIDIYEIYMINLWKPVFNKKSVHTYERKKKTHYEKQLSFSFSKQVNPVNVFNYIEELLSIKGNEYVARNKVTKFFNSWIKYTDSEYIKEMKARGIELVSGKFVKT